MRRRSLLLAGITAVLLPKTAISKLPAFDPGQYIVYAGGNHIAFGGYYANELWNLAPVIEAEGLTPEQVEQRFGIPAEVVRANDETQQWVRQCLQLA